MRLLLDENTDARLASVLTTLGHPSSHVYDLGLAGASDADLAALASQYDAFLTIDLHRQELEWLTINEAMLFSGIRVIRLRFAPKERTDLLGQVRALVLKWSEWELLLTKGTPLVTISRAGSLVRGASLDQIRAVLERRSAS